MIAAHVLDYDAVASRALAINPPSINWTALPCYQPRIVADLTFAVSDRGSRFLTPEEERIVLASLRSSSEFMYSF